MGSGKTFRAWAGATGDLPLTWMPELTPLPVSLFPPGWRDLLHCIILLQCAASPTDPKQQRQKKEIVSSNKSFLFCLFAVFVAVAESWLNTLKPKAAVLEVLQSIMGKLPDLG